ncbi:MAG: hypothetical protein IPK82_38335 [Polyangiaceae bacterium]|nr:hypothetical protein [Polyangiaceae bacterium]
MRLPFQCGGGRGKTALRDLPIARTDMPAKQKNAAPTVSTAAKSSKTAALATTLAQLTTDAKVASAASKKRAEALLDLIARRKARIAEDFYEIGKALKELQDKKLYLAVGYTSFEGMLDGRGVLSVTQARKLIQVVSKVPLATALKVGPEKAFALVKFTEVTPELDTPELLVEGGQKIGGKSAAEASVRDIAGATKTLRKAAVKKGGKVDAAQKEAEGVAKRGLAWLKGRGAKKARVEARKTKDGYVVTVTLGVREAAALFE